MSYKDKRELELMPGRIESLESSVAAINGSMADPNYFQQGGDRIATDAAKLKELQESLRVAYARWEELEG